MDDEHKERIGAQIRAAREKAGLSQEALGHVCGGLSATAIRNWEQGISFPRRKLWHALEHALGVPPGWFWALQSGEVLPAVVTASAAQTGGVNHGTVAGVVHAAPAVQAVVGGGDIARELCGLIARRLEGMSMDEQIAFRARVKKALEGE